MPQAKQQGLHLLAGKGIQRAKGLVEQQQLRICRQRAGNADPLTLAAGELPDKAFFRPFKAHFFQHPRGGCPALRFVDPGQLQPERDVILHVAPRQQPFMLKDHAAIGSRSFNPLAFEGDAAVLIRHESGNQVQQRGFTAAGGPQDHQQFAAVQRQVDIRQRRFTAVVGGKMRDVQHHDPLYFTKRSVTYWL